METLFGIAVIGVWIAISIVALKRAFGAREACKPPIQKVKSARA